MAGLLSMAALATTYTENHGHLEARTTEYAQDKLEQLLTLPFTDGCEQHRHIPDVGRRRDRARRRRQQ